MSIWPEDVQESVSKMGNDWVKPTEFEGEGLVLKINKVEKVKARNPKYGAAEIDYLVKNEILEVGETFHFEFETAEGEVRKLDSKSTPFFIGMKQSECDEGDWIEIKREGKLDKTRYTVKKVEKPAVSQRKKATEENLNPDDIPFD